MSQTYNQIRIAALTESIAAAQKELEFLSACEELEAMSQTAVITYCDVLRDHYKKESYLAFPDLFRYNSSSITHKIKHALSMNRISADTKKNPSWGSRALKLAQIMDNYKPQD
jgi:hypothetical protein